MRGDTQTQTLSFGPQHIRFADRLVGFSRRDTDRATVNLDFNRLPVGNGPLWAVHAIASTSTSASFDGTILVPGIAGVNANIDVRYCMNMPGTPASCWNSFFNQSGTFTSSQPVVHFGYGGPQTGGVGPVNVPAAGLAPYSGSGAVRISIPVEFVQEATVSNTGMQYHFESTIAGSVTLTYEFCPADFNADHTLNSQDFFDFIACFMGDACPAGRTADFNSNGVVDSQDFFDFISALMSGC